MFSFFKKIKTNK